MPPPFSAVEVVDDIVEDIVDPEVGAEALDELLTAEPAAMVEIVVAAVSTAVALETTCDVEEAVSYVVVPEFAGGTPDVT